MMNQNSFAQTQFTIIYKLQPQVNFLQLTLATSYNLPQQQAS